MRAFMRLPACARNARSRPSGSAGSRVRRCRSAGNSARTTSIGNVTSRPSGRRSVQAGRSTSTSTPGFASSHSCVASSTTTGSSPFFRQLLRKMSAISVLMTARMPKSSSAHGACSRDEPQPKLRPATSTWQPCGLRLVQHEVGLRLAGLVVAPVGEQRDCRGPSRIGGGQEAGRDDLVRVDVGGRHDDRPRADDCDRFHVLVLSCWRAPAQPRNSRGSVTRPRDGGGGGGRRAGQQRCVRRCLAGPRSCGCWC